MITILKGVISKRYSDQVNVFISIFHVCINVLKSGWAQCISLPNIDNNCVKYESLTTFQVEERILDTSQVIQYLDIVTFSRAVGTGISICCSSIMDKSPLPDKRMSAKPQKWFRLPPNGTNPGLFQIIFQYILAPRAKMY